MNNLLAVAGKARALCSVGRKACYSGFEARVEKWAVLCFSCVQLQNDVALRCMREVYADSTWSKEQSDALKTNALKTHTDSHTNTKRWACSS